MDRMIRQALREYRKDPTRETAYPLLQANRKTTGEAISQHVLDSFAKTHLIPVFLSTVERLREHNYIQDIDEYQDYYENLRYTSTLIDNIRVFEAGLIPKLTDHPFTWTIKLAFQYDLQFNAHAFHNRFESIILGTNLNNIQNTLNSLTFYDLRHYLNAQFDYDEDYVFDTPWGFQGVLAIPKSQGIDRQDAQHLVLLYTFYPDSKLWNLLISKEF